MEENTKINELIYQCRNGFAQERCSAIIELQKIRARKAVPELLELTDFPDVGVRANIACALGELGQKEKVGIALLNLVKDPDSLVRINAANSLGLLQYSEGINVLAHVLQNDEDPLVRVHAAEALGVMNKETVLPALMKALEDVDENVRAYAADSIGSIGKAEASSILFQKLNLEQSQFAKAFFLSALYRLGDEKSLFSLFDLVEIANDTLAVTILNLATELVKPENKETLKALMNKAAQSRQALRIEVGSIIKRLD